LVNELIADLYKKKDEDLDDINNTLIGSKNTNGYYDALDT